ncbi:serine/threonine protein phosphatase [Actibacterium mucosum KCTC 23349]|uniref:Serine/threonine protein phosphatase n=1 Tax=Actibacterium mucosum KCTC 23349 TaxID=1454373 RepID=A0A037ZLW9_9RHOB|nr:metallophosphoesterase [Actibacterium mucosum]KAJ57396.1 serine/threonine protein phosphatase [Actibacterium mucosum KCTC 23349]
MRAYAIGDIHGHLDKLVEIHRRIADDRVQTGDHEAPVVHLGDYADRGPDVPGVLDFLGDGLSKGKPWILIRGNHDRMMAAYLRDPSERDPLRDDLFWLQDTIGGRKTLEGYGVDVALDRDVDAIHADAIAAVSDRHLKLLDGLQNSFAVEGVFFCHAGIRPGVPLDDQSEDDLVWIRHDFLRDTRDHGALIVHGHTPVPQIEHAGNHLNIDTGAAYGGPLTCVVIEDGAVFELTLHGRVPVAADF